MISDDQQIQVLGTIFFAIAILHTFLAKPILHLSHKFPKGSARESVFHLLGEIEVVFGFWGALFLLVAGLIGGFQKVTQFVDQVHFLEPIFVFCVMVMAATKPVTTLARGLISTLGKLFSKALRIPRVYTDLFIILTIGPLAGSLITEPAAMTVTAFLLLGVLNKPSTLLLYSTLAVLFVNVSIGGALTHFAAPPILMVAGTWNWDLTFVFNHFGYKSFIAVVFNSLIYIFVFRKKIIKECESLGSSASLVKIPTWVTGVHLLFLFLLVISAHHEKIVFGIFLLFLGVTTVTKKYQETLRLRESLLVAFFLGGIILFGPFQKWWLEPLIMSLSETTLYYGAVALTAVTDNAALTYLGSQVVGLSEASKYYLVAGAIAGGGLTIIANAPNAAGYSILQSKFKDGMNPFLLLIAALIPTLIAVLALQFLPS